ncbi:MAG: triple tyrosine motif-containing protein, partial [Candidatus Nanopelagicaceae bacterium]
MCSTINIKSPLNKYYYLLEGADTSWHENSSGFLQFNNLQPGKYVLYTSS